MKEYRVHWPLFYPGNRGSSEVSSQSHWIVSFSARWYDELHQRISEIRRLTDGGLIVAPWSLRLLLAFNLGYICGRPRYEIWSQLTWQDNYLYRLKDTLNRLQTDGRNPHVSGARTRCPEIQDCVAWQPTFSTLDSVVTKLIPQTYSNHRG